MKKIYFEKAQKTNDATITKFYFNKNNKFFNNLQFLKDKITSLLLSEKTSASVKKQLNKLAKANFEKYDCFYIYSNTLCFGIDAQNKIIDFYKNDFDAVVDLQGFTKNYNCKIAVNQQQNQKVDASDF